MLLSGLSKLLRDFKDKSKLFEFAIWLRKSNDSASYKEPFESASSILDSNYVMIDEFLNLIER